MLVELRVRELGVIDDLLLQLGPGLTALTGETGAGKTLLVEALELLVGGRADPALVRTGSDEASVEARFLTGEGELVLRRVVPADGRSRAYVNGAMATAAMLGEVTADLVDLHGQHAHQSLLHQAAQRAALDRFAGADTEAVERASDALRALERRLGELGGDERALARELDLLCFQLGELDAARLDSPDEDGELAREEAILAAAGDLRRGMEAASGAIAGEDGARDLVARAQATLVHGHEAVQDLAGRMAALEAELDDLARELRVRSEGFQDDPERLTAVQERRRLLAELRRKYGPELADVIAFRKETRSRLDDLEAGESRRAEIARERDDAARRLAAAEHALGEARRQAAPKLGKRIQAHLRDLALPRAAFRVRVPEEGRGDEVDFLFGANPGERSLPLAKVASGGELARAMLATRLVLAEAPDTLVFDEVDAGVGGEAALSVGRSLARLAERHQVLVVTHLAQVAAFATSQIAVTKRESANRTHTAAAEVTGDSRLAELSRMLSGQPASEVGRLHARELLEAASAP